MRGFAKVHGEILTSSIWFEDAYTRLVFITMLVMADSRGRVRACTKGLAHEARVPLGKCRKALEILSSPDDDSKTKDDDGRRIAEIDGGWQLLNHSKYRDFQTEEQIKAAERKRRSREKTGQGVTCHVTRSASASASASGDDQGGVQGGSEPKSRRRTQVPDGLTPSPANIEYASKHGLDLEHQLGKFISHHQSKGSTFIDHQKALRTWLGNAVDYGQGRRGNSRSTGSHQNNHGKTGFESLGIPEKDL